MVATVRHVTSSSGPRKFQTNGFLSDRVHNNLTECGIPIKLLRLIRMCMNASVQYGRKTVFLLHECYGHYMYLILSFVKMA